MRIGSVLHDSVRWATAFGLAAAVYLAAAPVAPVDAATLIAVTTTTDELTTNGNCSLREAIRAVNLRARVDACPAGTGADTIVLPAGTFTLRLAGIDEDAALTGDLDLVRNVAIQGASASSTIVDGGGLDRVFDVQSGVTASLSRLTVRNGQLASVCDIDTCGSSAIGTGIRNAGTLTIDDAVVDGNTGRGQCAFHGTCTAGRGGGISNSGTLTVLNSVISHNGTVSDNGFGGGIDNTGTLSVVRSSITANSSFGGGSRFVSGNGLGAGIYNGGTATLTDTRLQGNASTGDFAEGGGIANDGTLTLSSVTITGDTSIGGSTGIGGGVYNAGTLHATATTISNNIVTGGCFGYGGGIANWGAPAKATIGGSSISGNSVSQTTGCQSEVWGGGVFNNGSLVLTNDTIAGNSAELSGGGIFEQTADPVNFPNGPPANSSLDNVTITRNTADSKHSGIGVGGGFHSITLTAANSIIAGNTAGTAGQPDCDGTLISRGHNLLGAASDCPVSGDTTGNLFGVDPRLGPLQDNGGPTPTTALLSGSPAIDAGSPAAPASSTAACLATDQRGISRPQDGNHDGRAVCDIGAFELQASAATHPPVVTASVAPTANAAGWNDTNVSVTLSASGVDAGVKSITFSATGAQPISSTTRTGSTTSIDITAEGTTTISYSAMDLAGNTALAKTLAVKIDKTRASCTLTSSGTDANGHTFIRITVQDTRSGLGAVQVTQANNASVPIPAFTAGALTPVVITATKIDQTRPSQVALNVSDLAGNVTSCDPILTEVGNDGPGGARPAEVFHHVAQGESNVTILNGAPGLDRLKLVVNGHVFEVRDLADGERRELQVAAAMRPGNNTIIIAAQGRDRGTASVLIADR